MYRRWDSPAVGGALLLLIIYGLICYFTPLQFDIVHAVSISVIGFYFGMVIAVQDSIFAYSFFPLLTFLLLIINTTFSPKDGMVSVGIFFALFLIGALLPASETFKSWVKPEIYCLEDRKNNPNFRAMGKIKACILILLIVLFYMIIIYYS